MWLSEPMPDAPVYVDDLAPLPVAQPPASPRRRLRNWQRFLVTYIAAMTAVAVILRQVVLRTGGNEAGGTFIVVLTAAIALACLVIIFTLAGRRGRL